MLDAVQIAARLRELSVSHPSAGLAELACHVLALAVPDRGERALLAGTDQLARSIALLRREVAAIPPDDNAGRHVAGIVATLQAIEASAAALRGTPRPPPPAALPDGPQRPARATGQADADRLLAAF